MGHGLTLSDRSEIFYGLFFCIVEENWGVLPIKLKKKKIPI